MDLATGEATKMTNHGVLSCISNGYKVSSTLTVNYELFIERSLLTVDNDALKRSCSSGRALVVVDSNVYGLYKDKIVRYFTEHEIEVKMIRIECGESNKTLFSSLEVIKEMESFGVLRRSEPVIAIGGGVLLDVVGFASSMYRRGVPYIRVPTTLMGMIDATLGVKTGVNHSDRRNRLGSYYGPTSAFIDLEFLKSLSSRELSNGAGEILKMAVVKDLELFEILEEKGEHLVASKFQEDTGTVSTIVSKSIKGMLDELVNNMWELDLKRLVDFGHSFSPLVEMESIPTLLHGEAVALDVVFSCALSHVKNKLTIEDLKRVMRVTHRLGLPLTHPGFMNARTLKRALEDTMKHRNGAQNLPLPISIGNSVFSNDVTANDIDKAIRLKEAVLSNSNDWLHK